MKGFIEFMQKTSGTEIDSPTLRGMFHIEILLSGCERKTSSSTNKSRLKYVKDLFGIGKNRLRHLISFPLLLLRPFPPAGFSSPDCITSTAICFELLAERRIICLIQKLQLRLHAAPETPEGPFCSGGRVPISSFIACPTGVPNGAPFLEGENFRKKIPETEEVGQALLRR